MKWYKLLFCSLFLFPFITKASEKRVINGVSYHIIEVDTNVVKIVWKDNKGRQLRTFSDAGYYLTAQGFTVKTVMNGGIFEPGGIPSGLLIQNGQTLRPLNTNKGKGNFFLKPNGIFYISPAGAFVVPTETYLLKKANAEQAIQSGPLLLFNGKIHSKFNKGSQSRLHRNGVGVLENGKVVFVMTDFDSKKFPNLYEFAQMFRYLGCNNALFLDGDLSQMKSGKDIYKPNNALGSMIAIIEDKK